MFGFLDALSIGRAILVGHPICGAIALSVTLTHPDRVAALALIGTGARLRVLPALLDCESASFDNVVRKVTQDTFATNQIPFRIVHAEQPLASLRILHHHLCERGSELLTLFTLAR